ncbi:MAG TPA: hypothetical protein VJ890_06275, partial [Vineibacter sp.]|nr:hypothetical protein [Vineibacter sp.]
MAQTTQVVRPPQQAKVTAPRPAAPAVKPPSLAAKPAAATKPIAVATPAVRRAPALFGGAASDEAKPFAIDPGRPLADQLATVGVAGTDAKAAERAVTEALKGAALAVGSTGRAALMPGTTPARLQGLQIFGPTGPVADIERMADGKFAAKSVAPPASSSDRPAGQTADAVDAAAVQDDPR